MYSLIKQVSKIQKQHRYNLRVGDPQTRDLQRLAFKYEITNYPGEE